MLFLCYDALEDVEIVFEIQNTLKTQCRLDKKCSMHVAYKTHIDVSTFGQQCYCLGILIAHTLRQIKRDMGGE